MTKERLELGRRGEDIAARFLKKMGYKIIERNFRCRIGEIDIIAFEKGVLIFIEIKTRTSDSFAPPQLSVNRLKQQKIINSALSYLVQKRITGIDCRFDIIAITSPADIKKGEKVTLIKDAFRMERW
ncbi:MAG: YraN family protein [Nitrospinota bacterium]